VTEPIEQRLGKDLDRPSRCWVGSSRIRRSVQIVSRSGMIFDDTGDERLKEIPDVVPE
jgi:predicted dienelactone hydrolase